MTNTMALYEIQDMSFRSALRASTDLHNTGTLHGIIYFQVLQFFKNGRVTLYNEMVANRAGAPSWEDAIANEKWEGTYSLEPSNKHIKCELSNNKLPFRKTIYADFATEKLLIAEVFENESRLGSGQVFIRMMNEPIDG